MSEIKRGDRCIVNRHAHHANVKPARIMAIAEGYAMLRYPGCSPFIEPLNGLSILAKEPSRDGTNKPVRGKTVETPDPTAQRALQPQETASQHQREESE